MIRALSLTATALLALSGNAVASPPSHWVASWQASPQLGFDLSLDNLLDKGYSRALYSHDGGEYGYREEGRAWMFGVTWTPQL